MAGGLGGLDLKAPKATDATASVGGHDGGGKELRPVWKVLGRTARRVLGAIESSESNVTGMGWSKTQSFVAP